MAKPYGEKELNEIIQRYQIHWKSETYWYNRNVENLFEADPNNPQ